MDYFSRSAAAAAAKKAGLVAFECAPDRGGRWRYDARPDGPGIKYAALYAAGHDWVNHCELGADKRPILICRITRPELPRDIPPLFRVAPLTPSLWGVQGSRKIAPPPGPGPALGSRFTSRDRLAFIFGEKGCLSK